MVNVFLVVLPAESEHMHEPFLLSSEATCETSNICELFFIVFSVVLVKLCCYDMYMDNASKILKIGS